MDIVIKKQIKKALLTTVVLPSISLVNQVPGQKIVPDRLDNREDCILLANNESFQSGKIQPAIGLHFLKENIPSADILEYPGWDEYKNALKKGYDVVAIGFYTTNFYEAVKMAKMAKEAGVNEVWAGNYGALTPGNTEYFDRVFMGYAERELKLALENEVLEDIKHPVLTTPFRVLPHLERAGFLVTKRGCKFKCKFCSTPSFSANGGSISMDEIERVLNSYKSRNVDYIIIADETFLQDLKHAKKVIRMLNEREMKWFCTTRADLLLGRVKELKEKGFDGVYMGIESLRDSNLSDQKKGESTTKVVKVLEELKQNGASASGTYILGLLNDTVSSIKEDIEKLNRLPLFVLVFLVFTPYPELASYKMWEKKGLIINHNWRDYDGMHMVFKHPFMKPEEAREVFEYAVCNVYSPYNYNKRRALLRLKKIENLTNRENAEKGGIRG